MKPLSSEDLDHILAHTEPLWEAARGQRIFISGGTGFFGAWLLESLAHCNRRLGLNVSATVLTRNPAAFREKMPHLTREPALEWVEGDVSSFAFARQEYAYVLHGAAPTTAIQPGQHFELLNTLLDGTKRMLALAEASNTRKFLFVSSGAVYGRQPEHLSHIPETYRGGPDWLDPAAVYAEGKRACELMCSLAARESAIDFRIARAFAFVGPHLPLDQHFAIGNFIADALAGRDIMIRGDGTTMRSYLYAADLAIWLWTMLLAEVPAKAEPLVLNVGSNQPISIRELAQQVVAELNPSLRIEIAGERVAGAPLQQYVPDTQMANACLNLRQTVTLQDAIRRTAAWHR